jgi:hypothetical protein
MAVRWEQKTALVSARDRAEHLLRSMPREKLAALHAGLNEGVFTLEPLAKRSAYANRPPSRSG